MNTHNYSTDYKKPSFRDYVDYFTQPFRCFRDNTKIKGLFKIDFKKVLHDKKYFYLNSEELEILKIKKNSQENLFYQFFKKYESSTALSIVTKYRETNNDFLDYLDNLPDVLQVTLKRKYLADFNEFLIILNGNCESAINTMGNVKIDINLNNSKVFKSLFKDETLFGKIDFTLLKERGIIYSKNSVELKLNSKRVPSDIMILMSYLISKNVIKVKYGEKYLKEVSDLSQSIGVTFDVSYISKIYNAIESNSHLSFRNSEVLEDVKDFMSQYI